MRNDNLNVSINTNTSSLIGTMRNREKNSSTPKFSLNQLKNHKVQKPAYLGHPKSLISSQVISHQSLNRQVTTPNVHISLNVKRSYPSPNQQATKQKEPVTEKRMTEPVSGLPKGIHRHGGSEMAQKTPNVVSTGPSPQSSVSKPGPQSSNVSCQPLQPLHDSKTAAKKAARKNKLKGTKTVDVPKSKSHIQ